MTEVHNPIAMAITASAIPGREFVPTKLLAIMNAEPNPASTINDLDRGTAQFDAIRQEFGFVHIHRVTGKAPSDHDIQRLAALMRWLLKEFQGWNPHSDPNRGRLATLFVITADCNQDGDFWPLFASSIRANPELVTESETRIGSLIATPTISSLSRTPTSDQEILDRFNAADRSGDWTTIASDWHSFGDLIYPDSFISQSVRYLHSVAPDALRRAADKLRQMAPAMLLLQSLTVNESLSLALTSTNAHLEFGALLRLCQQRRHQSECAGQGEESLLTQVFLKVASDSARWRQWMRALNRYPIRYPRLQRPLGRALATVPDTALQAYIDVIELTTLGTGRAVVADCLRSFNSIAAPERRKMLWHLAHKRWSDWQFGKNEEQASLVQIGYSQLDYAVVGYAIECMNTQQRTEKKADLIAELSALPDAWHASAAHFMQGVYRILSFYQPYAYAQQIGLHDDWLMEGRYMLPFDPQTDHYHSKVYKLRT